MLMMVDTFQHPIRPYGLWGQSPIEDDNRHAIMALWSSDLDNNLACSTLGDIDPEEPKNMAFLVAFDLTQAARESSCSNDVACQNI